ncbi:MAG TPA: serine/threonine-protein kinase, partial [Polyangiaceae bacterium]|nr:serine/threonine-protein kinase [Polyangiaceae bacterium]
QGRSARLTPGERWSMVQSSGTPDDAIDRIVGTTVANKYRIDRLLGRGGMGAVFQATNTVINKRVALKFLSEAGASDAQAAQRFQREAEAASLVESEHIVQIFDFGSTEQGMPFLVMELLTGHDLRALLKREHKLLPEPAVKIAVQILRALVRAHAAGIVHRDLKPDNVFLCERDAGDALVKIVDFGISKLARKVKLDTLTQRGTILGTAFYMSPEQAQGLEEVDARADLYSVGAILYEMLAARPPHTAPTYEAVLVAICTRDAADVREHSPDVPLPIARTLHKALARDRELRFQSASEMLSALEAALAGRLDPDLDTAPMAAPIRRTLAGVRLARRRTLVLALVALLFGFAVTALFLSRGRSAAVDDDRANVQPRASEAPPTLARTGAEPALSAVSSAAAGAAAPIDSAKPPGAAARTTAPAASRKHPSEATASSASGVAGTLRLNTSGP